MGWAVNPLTKQNWGSEGYQPGILSGNMNYKNEIDSSAYLQGLKQSLIQDLEKTGASIKPWKEGDVLKKDAFIIGFGSTTESFFDSRENKEKNSYHMIRGDSNNGGKNIFWSEKTGLGSNNYVDSLGEKKVPKDNGNRTNPPIKIIEFFVVSPGGAE